MTRKLIEKMLEEQEWSLFFVMSCEYGPDRLTSQAWQWEKELSTRGHPANLTAVEDALLELAHELLPDSPAGTDPRSYLFNRAARWIGSKPFETTDAEDAVLNEAFYGDLAGFREALRAWCKVGLAKPRGTRSEAA